MYINLYHILEIIGIIAGCAVMAMGKTTRSGLTPTKPPFLPIQFNPNIVNIDKPLLREVQSGLFIGYIGAWFVAKVDNELYICLLYEQLMTILATEFNININEPNEITMVSSDSFEYILDNAIERFNNPKLRDDLKIISKELIEYIVNSDYYKSYYQVDINDVFFGIYEPLVRIKKILMREHNK